MTAWPPVGGARAASPRRTAAPTADPTDFSTRLQPQPGMKVIYARTTIASDREVVKKLAIGYSDDVACSSTGGFSTGAAAPRPSATRASCIVSPENDAVYLPLKKGKNEVVLAVSELGGGVAIHLPARSLAGAGRRRNQCRGQLRAKRSNRQMRPLGQRLESVPEVV